MHIVRNKQVSDEVFMSFSDETKIRMTNNQVYIFLPDDGEETWETIYIWLCENNSNIFSYEEKRDDDGQKIWICFYEESDMVAFKLRWT